MNFNPGLGLVFSTKVDFLTDPGNLVKGPVSSKFECPSNQRPFLSNTLLLLILVSVRVALGFDLSQILAVFWLLLCNTSCTS